VPATIVSAKVIGLMKGVPRTMMLTKLKIATAVVLVAVAVVSARGVFLPDPVVVDEQSQVAKAASPAIDEGGESKDEAKKAPDEPAWKKEFREKYGLKEGEHVKRIAPPYPSCRSDFLTDQIKGTFDPTKFGANVLGWKDGWAPGKLGLHVYAVKPEQGIPIDRLIDLAAGIPATRIEGLEKLLVTKATGDFVVRDGATPDQIVTQLETILKRECGLAASFQLKDAEQEVFVLEGKYEAKPLDGRKKNEIEVYAQHLADRKFVGGGTTGTFEEFLAHLERHVRVPVLAGKIEGLPKNVRWHYNVRENGNGKTSAEDTNAATVLDNIASQTGLTVKTEKKKVRVLVVESAKADK
jgi:hypothetical protein